MSFFDKYAASLEGSLPTGRKKVEKSWPSRCTEFWPCYDFTSGFARHGAGKYCTIKTRRAIPWYNRPTRPFPDKHCITFLKAHNKSARSGTILVGTFLQGVRYPLALARGL